MRLIDLENIIKEMITDIKLVKKEQDGQYEFYKEVDKEKAFKSLEFSYKLSEIKTRLESIDLRLFEFDKLKIVADSLNSKKTTLLFRK